MRWVCRLTRVLAVLVLTAGGCNEVTTPDTVQVREAVIDALDQTPIEGATMCSTEAPVCATSDGSGLATLVLPSDQRVSYIIEKEGYGSVLTPVVTPKDATVVDGTTPMELDEWLADNFTNLQSDYPLEDKGAIQVRILNRFAGSTFELLGATGTRFYTDEEGNWRLDLEATTSGADRRDRTAGGFVDVGPGTFQIEIGGTTGGCGPLVLNGARFAWPGDSENRFEVPVQAGVFTRVFVSCAEPF
jgi:hypothetical protein